MIDQHKHSVFGVWNINIANRWKAIENENKIIICVGTQGSYQSEGGALIRTCKVENHLETQNPLTAHSPKLNSNRRHKNGTYTLSDTHWLSLSWKQSLLLQWLMNCGSIALNCFCLLMGRMATLIQTRQCTSVTPVPTPQGWNLLRAEWAVKAPHWWNPFLTQK